MTAMRIGGAVGLVLGLGTGVVAEAQTTHALIVSGVSGEARLAQQFERDAGTLRDALTKRFGATVAVLSESSTPRSDRSGIIQALQKLGTSSKPGDQVLIILLGHGSAQGGAARFNIPGPDITADEIARALEPLEGRSVAMVVATSASGAFISPLNGAGRVIVTATKTGAQNEEVVFATHFAKALSEDVADINKDGAVSLAEAFEYSQREVARFYEQNNRMATEQATLSGAGADAFVLRSGASKAADPVVQRLYAERALLQQRITAHKDKKGSMRLEAYETELEKLLFQLAVVERQIRVAEQQK